MTIEQILQCLESVITYDKGEGVPIVQYDNQFLLDKEDIQTLLNYIIILKAEVESITGHYRNARDLCLRYQKRNNEVIEFIDSQSPDAGVCGKTIKEIILKGSDKS